MTTATAAASRTDQPRIYVACLASYNAGILHGAWIDAMQEPWAIYDEVKAMLTASPIAGSDEWAIHDHEFFDGARIEEYTSFETVSALAAFIGEYGALGAALLDHYCGDLGEAREAIDDRYHGCHASLADYMQELTEETTIIPESLRYYIDWQAIAATPKSLAISSPSKRHGTRSMCSPGAEFVEGMENSIATPPARRPSII